MALMIIIAIIVLGFSLYEYFDSKDWQQINCVERINVVFEERNKKYGAYSIRRDYNDQLLFIVLGMIGLVGILTIVTSGLRLPMEELQAPIIKMDTTLLTLAEPPVDKIETIESPYKIVGGGGGSGTPDNSKYDPTPNPMVKQHDTQAHSDNHIFSGKGNKTTGKNQNEEASSTNKSPFSGSGGKNGGDKGGIFGNDNGPGSGPGNGPGNNGGNGGTVKRYLITTLKTSNIESDENCTVTLTVKINADGDVVGTPTVKREKTSTSNSVIIDAVIRMVKEQAKFNKVEGAAVTGLLLPVNVRAN